jgi:hypothetical protein
MTVIDRTQRIRELNDHLRTTFTGGAVLITQGIENLPLHVRRKLLAEVRHFQDFSECNDPHQEHDFAALTVDGKRVCFKIDYYDRHMKYGSEDPADPAKTTRVLTISTVEEF